MTVTAKKYSNLSLSPLHIIDISISTRLHDFQQQRYHLTVTSAARQMQSRQTAVIRGSQTGVSAVRQQQLRGFEAVHEAGHMQRSPRASLRSSSGCIDLLSDILFRKKLPQRV